MYGSIRTEPIIYLYLFACFAFLLFNLIYINWLNRKKRDNKYRITKMRDEIQSQFKWVSETGDLQPRHVRFLLKKLANVELLLDYSNALELLKQEYPKAVLDYLNACTCISFIL